MPVTYAATSVPSWTVYQPLIVGFSAVVLGLIANTLLEWFKASIQDAHAARVLRKALVEELRTALEAADFGAKTAREPIEAGKVFTVPIAERYPIYEANILNLGRLASAEVAAVAKAYSYLRAVPEFLIHAGQITRAQNTVLVAVVPGENKVFLAAMASSISENIEPAVKILDARIQADDRSLWQRITPRFRRGKPSKGGASG